MKCKKGISLISLVVTIIVLLILIGIVVLIALDGSLLGLTKETKEDAIVAGINGYAKSVKSVIVLEEGIDPEDVVDVFISQVETDNNHKDDQDKYEVVDHDKINKTVTLKKDDVEVIVDLNDICDDADPSDISKSDICSRYTITFKYKEANKEKVKKMVVLRNQTLQQYLNESGDSVPSSVDRWVPEIQYNTPVVANMKYKQYIKRLDIVNAHFNLAGGTLNGETDIESKEYIIGDIVEDIGTPTKEHYNFTGWIPPLEEKITETTTFTAQWAPVTYTFTFNLGGGNIGGSTANKTTSGKYGTSSSTPENPTRTHYTFGGWSPSVPSTFDGNKSFTAQWNAVTYTFTFDLNGGSLGGSTTNKTTSGKYGTNSTTPGTPTRTGCTFDGWSPSVPGTFDQNRSFTAQWRVTFTFDNGRTTTGLVGTSSSTPSNPTRTHYTFNGWSPSVPGTFDQNRSFTAQWSAITYTFTFKLNGGSVGGSTADRTTSGTNEQTATTPGTPTRTHYTFEGWSPSVPNKYDGNKSFTAQWKVITYTYTFDLNGGSIGGSTANRTTSGNSGSSSSTPGTPTRTGCTFDGWDLPVPNTYTGNRTFTAQWRVTFTFDNGRTTSGLVGTPSSTPSNPTRTHYTFNGWSPSVPGTFDQNRSFTAQWSAITYTFTFKLNGGSIGGSTADRTTSGTNEQTATTPGTPTRTGYTFNGWSPSVPSQYDKNESFTAQWSIITYTITYNLNGGTYGGSTANVTRSVAHGSMPPNLTPTRSGYTFNGWSPGLTYATRNETYIAQWSIITYTITYNLNGGTYGGSTANVTRSVAHGSMPPNLTPTRSGYTFNGWSPGLTYATRNETYIAQWTRNIVYYTITYVLNGGTYGGSTANVTRTVEEGTMPPNLTPTRSGYTFNGWSPSLIYATSNRTYTAQWTRNTVYYTITYNFNGGTYGGSTANVTRTVEEGTMPPNLTPTRSGYTFNGWSPSLTYATSSRTYTAQWKVITYTISYNTNGGSGTFTSQTRTHGGANVYTHSHSPTRTGYTFDGWLSHMRPDRLYPPNTPYGWDASTTMVAQWSVKVYTISYNTNGGSGSFPSQTRTHGGANVYTHSHSPTRSGYTFNGWLSHMRPDRLYPPNTPYGWDASTTMVAQWTQNTVYYTITYNLAGGRYNNSTTNPTRQVARGTMPPNLTPTRTNYHFLGWTPTLANATANRTYTAQWTTPTIFYTITYRLNGGRYNNSTANVVRSVEEGTMPPNLTPTRTNYSFTGWSPTRTVALSDKTYTAQWRAIGVDPFSVDPVTPWSMDLMGSSSDKDTVYKIIYDLNGGKYDGSKTNPISSVEEGIMPPNLIPTRSGYTFTGWSPSLTEATSDKTYIAQWTPISYTITYNLNGGKYNGFAVNPIRDVEYNTMPPEFIPTRKGYVFIEWSPAITVATENKTYMAIWSLPMVLEMKKASLNEEILIPVEMTAGNSIYISNNGGEYIKYTTDNPTITNTVPAGETFVVEIAGRINKLDYSDKPKKQQAQLYKIVDWGELGATSFSNSFYACTNLIGPIPLPRINSFINVVSFTGTFYGCKNLTGNIPAGLFDNCPNVVSFLSTFYYCEGLTGSIPEGLFDNCPDVKTFEETFYHCTDLTGQAPTLWTTHKSAIGTHCFYQCVELSKYKSIPSTWK